MTLRAAIAGTIERESLTVDAGTPVSHRIGIAGAIGIRPTMMRQERVGLNRAEPMPHVTSGRSIVALLAAKRTAVSRIPIAA